MCTYDLPYAIAKMGKGWEKATEKATAEHSPEQHYFDAEEIANQLNKKPVIEFSSQTFFRPSVKLRFNQVPQPTVNKNFNLLIDTLKSLDQKKYTTLVFSESAKQIERLESIFDDLQSGYTIQPVYKSLSEGFVDHDLKIAAYTEHQIFNRFYLAKSGSKNLHRDRYRLKNYKTLILEIS